MTQSITVAQDSTRINEGPQIVFEGDQPVYAIQKEGVTTITNDASLTMWVYKGSTDLSSTYLTGSMSAVGNVAITKTFTGLVGGDTLFVGVRGTLDGVLLTMATFELRVRRKSGK